MFTSPLVMGGLSMSALRASHRSPHMHEASGIAPTFRRRVLSLMVLVATTTLAACGGGGGGGGGGGSVPPPPGPVTLTTNGLVFLQAGSAVSQNVAAAESNYSGPFSATSSNCSGIATATLQPASTGTFTIVPIGSGACTYAINGAPGQSQSLAISVTTTSVGGT
jgi:hypothetical protein